MEQKQLIVIKQEPRIEVNLNDISKEIEEKVTKAKSLICNEENKQTIKKTRAELNKELKYFEEKRKEVKEKILTPYTKFEEIYKACISDKYREADQSLKEKIDEVENEIKKQKEQDLKDYFEEYKNFKNVSFLNFEQANFKIGLNDSLATLKKQAQLFIDKVLEDVNTINTQDKKEEIMVEYKLSLNLNQAITTVTNRYKAIEEEKKRQEEERNTKEQEPNNFKVMEKQEILQAPVQQEEIFTLKFTVKATKSKLKELKQFLDNGGYKYE